MNFFFQEMRTNNPHQASDTCIISVEVDMSQVEFTLERLYANEFVVHLLAGQHICLADKHMMETFYRDTAPGNVPSSIMHKNVEIYINLTLDERLTFVRVDNERTNQKMVLFDQVISGEYSHRDDIEYRIDLVFCECFSQPFVFRFSGCVLSFVAFSAGGDVSERPPWSVSHDAFAIENV